jgi:hypothetical protein
MEKMAQQKSPREGGYMSSFRAMTRATDKAVSKYPEFAVYKPANWIDNYFGPRQYGVEFDGCMILRDNGDFEYNPDIEVEDD